MTDTTSSAPVHYPLFLDEPANVDLLSFDAVAATLVDALTDPLLDPIALGLSGAWGSGKTSVLRLIADQLTPPDGEVKDRLVVGTDPWRYDPQLGAKESLVGEVLAALATEIPEDETGEKARNLLKRLAKRIDWGKALRVVANSAITVSLPSIDDITRLVKPKEEESDPEPIADMNAFRAEFERLLGMPELAHLKSVVVLVDDLDRCLPETVVETLETIRLFLSVPKMSFVIAADEARVAEAIATHFPTSNTPPAVGEESQSQLYLHKIVQTSVPVPALSDFDTEAYLVLLQVQTLMDADDYSKVVAEVAAARRAAQPLESVARLSDAAFAEARNNAARIKPIVHEKSKGNPRRIKRFLNDVSVRLGIASRRGITLDPPTIAKLMVLEQYFASDFETVTSWLSQNTLRAHIAELEKRAGTPDSAEASGDADTETPAVVEAPPARPSGRRGAPVAPEPDPRFSEGLIRWARLSPSLVGKDIAPYLVFAASFRQILLTADALPERVRDLATLLLSGAIRDNQSVTREMLVALSQPDATALIRYIGGVAVDQPDRQTAGVTALIRIARYRADAVAAVVAAVRRIPARDLRAGGIIAMEPTDPQELFDTFEEMAAESGNDEISGALNVARNEDA